MTSQDLPAGRDVRVLPAVLRIRERIDDVFARYVGPIAPELSRDEFEHWCAEGQVGPSGLHRYIARLGRYLSDEASRRAFIGEASHCIQLQNPNKR